MKYWLIYGEMGTLKHSLHQWHTFFFLKKDFIYLFLERGEGRKKVEERNIDQLPLICTPTKTEPAT